MIKKATEAIGQNIWIVFVCLAFFLCMDLFGSGSEPDEEEFDRDLTGWETIITPEEYRQIEIGMTYEEVRNIVGGEGKVVDKNTNSIDYAWPGEHYWDKYYGLVEIRFETDLGEDTPTARIIRESEVVDGEECYDTWQKIDQGKYSELETPVTSERQEAKLHGGMSYGQVCAVMRGEGVLYGSGRGIYDIAKRKKVQQYVWRQMKGDPGHRWIYYVSVKFENGVSVRVY